MLEDSVARGLVALLILGTILASGCAGPSKPVVPSLTRSIVYVLDGDSQVPSDPQDFLGAVKATFVYKHTGPDLQVAKVQVTYTNAELERRTRPLSAFTLKDVLKAGDTVRISGAAFTSDVLLSADGNIVAHRTGHLGAWLVAHGKPIPLEAKTSAKASYTYSAQGAIGLDIDRTGYHGPAPGAPPCQPQYDRRTGSYTTCDDDPQRIDVDYDATTMRGDGQAAGRISLSALPDGSDMRVTVKADVRSSLNFTLSTRVTEGTRQEGNATSTSYPAGVSATYSAKADGRVGLLFANGQILSSSGFGGNATTEGHMTVWDLHHRRDENYEPEPGNHTSVHTPYRESAVPGDPFDLTLEKTARVLSALWNTSLEPGDTVRVETNLTRGGYGIASRYELTVVSLEDRQVGTEIRNALRLHNSFVVSLATPGERNDLQAIESTFWTDAATDLPISADVQFRKSFTQTDFASVFDAMHSLLGDAFTIPQQVGLTMNGESHLSLASLQGSLRTAPIVSMATALLMPELLAHADDATSSIFGP